MEMKPFLQQYRVNGLIEGGKADSELAYQEHKKKADGGNHSKCRLLTAHIQGFARGQFEPSGENRSAVADGKRKVVPQDVDDEPIIPILRVNSPKAVASSDEQEGGERQAWGAKPASPVGRGRSPLLLDLNAEHGSTGPRPAPPASPKAGTARGSGTGEESIAPREGIISTARASLCLACGCPPADWLR